MVLVEMVDQVLLMELAFVVREVAVGLMEMVEIILALAAELVVLV